MWFCVAGVALRDSLHSTLHTFHSTLSSPHSTLHTPHCTLHTAHSTLHRLNFTLHTPYFTLHTTHSTHNMLHSTLDILHSTLHSDLHSGSLVCLVVDKYILENLNDYKLTISSTLLSKNQVCFPLQMHS